MIIRRLARPLTGLSSSSWICPSCSRASPAAAQFPTSQARKLHHSPPITHLDHFSQHGVRNLLSATGFKLAWTDHMDMMISKLNQLTAGEETYDKKPKDIVLQYARDPMNASLFNHASMVENSRFFFDGLSPSDSSLSDPSVGALRKSLEQTFGSEETLQTAMLDTASAMFGPGFVWLVWARDVAPVFTRRNGDWRILTTYSAGTPYPEAGYRQQGIDMNTSNGATFDAYAQSKPVNTVGAFGPLSSAGQASAKIPPGGTNLMPVLCVNTWQHVYFHDYGVQGKRQYLAEWWATIDWNKVSSLTPDEALHGQYLRG